MSDEIQAISQGNYILATQQEVSHDNTLSGNGTVDSPLGLSNETLLYSGGNTASFTTTEQPSNFEYLRVHYTRGGNIGYISLVEPNNSYITYGGLIYDINEGAHLQEVAGCFSSTNGLNWVVAGQNRRWNNGTTGVNGTTATGQHYITKIVGINRKAQ